MNKYFSYLTFACALGMIPVASHAADKTDGKSNQLAVEKIICSDRYMAPASGAMSPNYQAGVDVKGNPVVPADLNPVPVAAPTVMEVPMTYDLAKKLGQNLPEGIEMKGSLASIKLYSNGKVEYNGQDISSNAAAMCGKPFSGTIMSPKMPNVAPMPPQADYVAPPIQPVQSSEPVAAATASSATVSEPAPPAIDIQRGTVNITR